MNFNLEKRSFSSKSIFGEKSLSDLGIEAGSSRFFGKKTKAFSKYLKNSKELGEFTLDKGAQFLNYGAQKKAKKER